MARLHFLTSRSRTLRRDSTDAEAMLWGVLRSRQLGGLKFRRQVEIGGYIADFLCPERRLIIEVDGQAHNLGNRPVRDEERTAFLAKRGYRLLRISAEDVLKDPDAVAASIVAYAAASPLHRPSAGPRPRPGEDL